MPWPAAVVVYMLILQEERLEQLALMRADDDGMAQPWTLEP